MFIFLHRSGGAFSCVPVSARTVWLHQIAEESEFPYRQSVAFVLPASLTDSLLDKKGITQVGSRYSRFEACGIRVPERSLCECLDRGLDDHVESYRINPCLVANS